MYSYRALPIEPFLAAKMAAMPFNVLIAIPPYITPQIKAPVYNLIGDMNLFLGRAVRWNRKTKVIAPRLWAPEWSNDELRSLVEPRFLENGLRFPFKSMRGLRTDDFLNQETFFSPKRKRNKGYEIIHFIGHVLNRNGEPTLRLEFGFREQLRPGGLRDALIDAQTRLLMHYDWLKLSPAGADRLFWWLPEATRPTHLRVTKSGG